MDFSQKALKEKINAIEGKDARQRNRFYLFLLTFFVALFLGTVFVFFSFTAGAFTEIIDNAPDIKDITAIQPSQQKSIVYASDGSIMQELIQSGSNRVTVSYDDMPQDLVYAFVSIEDARFFKHDGVDVKGIIRAFFSGLRAGSLDQGGSTLTQQLIKNNVFNGGLESNYGDRIERKLQEQYLALKVERELDKETIVEYYLNTINLGSNCLGVEVASQRYFGKSVSELDLSECAVLAAITQNPGRFNPITHPEENQKRRLTVLKYMMNDGYIDEQAYEEASAPDVYDRIRVVSENTDREKHAFSYFTDAVFEDVVEALKAELDLTDTQAYNLMYSGGLRIYSTMDPALQKIAEEEINDPENYIVTEADGTEHSYVEYALSYRLTLELRNGDRYYYDESHVRNYYREELGDWAFDLIFDTEDEAREAANRFRTYLLARTGGSIVSETMIATLQPQSSAVIMDQTNGHVLAVVGGRGNKDEIGSLSLNRAVTSTRQPGSCFKILTAYGPALDISGATLGDTFYDAPLSYGSKSIRNWWGRDSLGYTTMRYAIMASMNVVAVKCFEDVVGEDIGYGYAQEFGITTLVDQDKSPVMTLGGLTYGVTNVELTGAYAGIANNGVWKKPVFWTTVTDANGNVLLTNPEISRVVIRDTTAMLLTSALEESIYPTYPLFPEYGVGATSADCQIENMAAAGKSGTTTDANDIWFVGYTPYYTLGVWSGYDSSKSFGTSPGYHKKIWQKIMSRAVEDKEPQQFDYSALETVKICSKSGLLARPGICDNCGDPNAHVYEECYVPGTAPEEYCSRHVQLSLCKVSGRIAGEYCPQEDIETRVYLIVDEGDIGPETDDTKYEIPEGLLVTGPCNVHVQPVEETKETEKETEETEETKETKTP